MKKFVKIALIAAAISASLGVFSICIGWAMGGSLHDYNQIGIFYRDGDLELYPKFEDFDDQLENSVEGKIEPIEEKLEHKLEQWERITDLEDFLDF